MSLGKRAGADRIIGGHEREGAVFARRVADGEGDAALYDAQRAGSDDEFVFARDVFLAAHDVNLGEIECGLALAGVGARVRERAVGNDQLVAALQLAVPVIACGERRAVIFLFSAGKREDDRVLPLGLKHSGGAEHDLVATLDDGGGAVGKAELPARKDFSERECVGTGLRVERGDRISNRARAFGDRQLDRVAARGDGRGERGRRAGGVAHGERRGGIDALKLYADRIALAAAVEDRADGRGVIALGKDRGGQHDRACGVGLCPGDRKKRAALGTCFASVRDDHHRAQRIARGRRERHTAAAQVCDGGRCNGRAGGVFPEIHGKALAERAFDLLGGGERLVSFAVRRLDRQADRSRVRRSFRKGGGSGEREELDDKHEGKQDDTDFR